MTVEKQPIPAEWTGDTTLPYNERYKYYFPGEPEAKGFQAPAPKSWKGGRGK